MLPLVSLAATAAAPLAEAAVTVLTQSPRTAPAVDGPSFGDVMQQFATQTIDSLKNGESVAISGVQGGASAQKVVSAVMQAERDLHTAVALRDKAVAAYQEISRMAI
jgi:flagellar hook-basal body complex protein FliE